MALVEMTANPTFPTERVHTGHGVAMDGR
jgi:hypothetical protein